MINKQKQFSKFQNYWFHDSNFRSQIYNNFYCDRSIITIYSRGFISDALSEYKDTIPNVDNVWSFLVGLIFPNRFSNWDESYWKLGKEMSLGGNWIKFWIWAAENNFILENKKEQETMDILGLSRKELEIFYHGCFHRDLIVEPSIREKAIYLIGRDFSNQQNREAIKKMILK
jgi:hypothetical protein